MLPVMLALMLVPAPAGPQDAPAQRPPERERAKPADPADPVQRKPLTGTFKTDLPLIDRVIGGAGDADVTDPRRAWVAAQARLGLGWLSGSAVRDTRLVPGTQVSLQHDLDLDSPKAVGAIGLQFRPIGRWYISAELAWAGFDGRVVQGGASGFSTTPPVITFDGSTYTLQILDSEFEMLTGSAGVWYRMDPLEHASVELGAGAHAFLTNLEIAAVGGPRVSESSRAITPWFGGRIEMAFTSWIDLEFGGRFGAFWAGDSVRYYVHALANFWAAVVLPLGPLRVQLRLDYLLVHTHERAHGQDEIMGVSLVAPAVALGFRF